MNCRLSRVVICAALALGPAMTAGSAADEQAPSISSSVVDGNTVFALDLYKELKSGEGNLFFSPYSISTALAMTYGGARGETAREMENALHFDLGQDRLHSAFADLAARLNAIQ